MSARRYLVSGRVQAVGYRVFAARAAEDCEVHGFVRNLRDGRVEVVAVGTEPALARFRERLSGGPPMASVESVVESVIDESAAGASPRRGFTIESTV